MILIVVSFLVSLTQLINLIKTINHETKNRYF